MMARPEHVAIRRDHDVIPCELALEGVKDDGVEVWRLATELRTNDELIVAGGMPANTEIVGHLRTTVRFIGSRK